MTTLARGQVVWVDFDPVKGHEQGRRRPALVISTSGYLSVIPSVAVVLPVTSLERKLPHHVRLTGDALELGQPSFAMTEQPRTVDLRRIDGTAGSVDSVTMASVDLWLRDWLLRHEVS